MATSPLFGWEEPDDVDLVKDGAAAIRTLGNAIDTSMGDLLGGTTGQVLSKASNTNMDFTWVTSDDANAIQNSIVDAKGDLIAASAADTPARLAVGSNYSFLQALSSETTGLKWGGALTSYTPTVTASSGTITSYTSSGTYIQIGKLVFFRVSITITNAGTGAASLIFSIPISRATANTPISGQEVSATGKALTGNITGLDSGSFRFYDWTTCIATNNVLQVNGFYEVA
ncbi:hypothetical protein UFOVP362_15 [uncultured Caudovirales phage]|uniref:Bacteriophage lambda, Stf, side tail fibre-repeat-2 n=1 Tax=uncultured Caudovirales phage TaxID=2100421 RepID=A0A6J7WVN8_9CAUD|nr:hypothetical protein UFOVP362_15 [uncultured Caudovirales phage]